MPPTTRRLLLSFPLSSVSVKRHCRWGEKRTGKLLETLLRVGITSSLELLSKISFCPFFSSPALIRFGSIAVHPHSNAQVVIRSCVRECLSARQSCQAAPHLSSLRASHMSTRNRTLPLPRPLIWLSSPSQSPPNPSSESCAIYLRPMIPSFRCVPRRSDAFSFPSLPLLVYIFDSVHLHMSPSRPVCASPNSFSPFYPS